VDVGGVTPALLFISWAEGCGNDRGD